MGTIVYILCALFTDKIIRNYLRTLYSRTYHLKNINKIKSQTAHSVKFESKNIARDYKYTEILENIMYNFAGSFHNFVITKL